MIIPGTPGNDELNGTNSEDTITGLDGNDRIFGRWGNDDLYGNAGNDYLDGENGSDLLDGGSGNDTLLGGADTDDLYGGAGNDCISGGASSDRLNGTDKTAKGRGEIDTLIGGDGGDLFVLGSAEGTFYDDGSAGPGLADYALITDFDPTSDQVELHGSRSLYFLGASPVSGVEGSGIFYDSNGNGSQDANDELIAILQSESSLTAANVLDRAEFSLDGPRSLESILDVLDSGLHWNGGPVTYSFAGNLASINETNVQYVSEEVKTATREIMNLLTALTGLETQEVTTASADIRLFSADLDGIGGYANFPNNFSGGNIVFDAGSVSDVSHNSYGYEIILHEVGHAMGLNHTFGGDTELNWAEDNFNASVMSYSLTHRFSTSGDFATFGRFASSYQIYDIAALQAMYGVNRATFAGASNHILSPALGKTQTIWDGGGTDTLSASSGTDAARLDLREGLDHFSKQGDIVRWLAVGSNIEHATGAEGNDTIFGSDLANNLLGQGGNDSIEAGLGNDTVNAGTGNDTVNAGAGADLVYGETGDSDLLIGGAGLDTLAYTGVSRSAAAVGKVSGSEFRVTIGGFTDTLSQFEFITFADDTINLTLEIGPTPYDDILIGTDGNDNIDALAGADTMSYGLGDDTYWVDNVGDLVTELPNAGNDLVNSSISYRLTDNVERLILLGSLAINGTGNVLNNRITGNSAANVINGGAGNDTMTGGAGNDTYYVDATGDAIIESAGQGTDTVISSLSHTLAVNVENLILTATGAVNGRGNSQRNAITGGNGANALNGMAGADTMTGLGGNDTYYVDNTGDVVVESMDGGEDTVVSTVTRTLGAWQEHLILSGTTAINGRGNELKNRITGNSAANSLNGMAGADTMAGGLGNDTYYIDHTGDVVIENAGEGRDTVVTSTTHTLAANLENLVLTGTAAINGTGNSADNHITGNAENNLLDGLTGDDTMIGGLGNDTYAVDSYGDVISENAGGGTDTVFASLTYRLTANLENLTLTGMRNIDAYGNAGNNRLVGNSGANRLLGGGGADSMVGGLGNDTYTVDHAGDRVTENASGGSDVVRTRLENYTLAHNVERLVLLDSVARGTGNTLNNKIFGNTKANALFGDSGNDTLYGAAGDDTLTGAVGYGIGERDLLNAGGGKDVFVLGTRYSRLYDDGQIGGGFGDYAWITSFRPSDDRLVLHGEASEYFLRASPVPEAGGKGIFHDSNENGAYDLWDELIAVVRSPEKTTFANTIGNARFV